MNTNFHQLRHITNTDHHNRITHSGKNWCNCSWIYNTHITQLNWTVTAKMKHGCQVTLVVRQHYVQFSSVNLLCLQPETILVDFSIFFRKSLLISNSRSSL